MPPVSHDGTPTVLLTTRPRPKAKMTYSSPHAETSLLPAISSATQAMTYTAGNATANLPIDSRMIRSPAAARTPSSTPAVARLVRFGAVSTRAVRSGAAAQLKDGSVIRAPASTAAIVRPPRHTASQSSLMRHVARGAGTGGAWLVSPVMQRDYTHCRSARTRLGHDSTVCV